MIDLNFSERERIEEYQCVREASAEALLADLDDFSRGEEDWPWIWVTQDDVINELRSRGTRIPPLRMVRRMNRNHGRIAWRSYLPTGT